MASQCPHKLAFRAREKGMCLASYLLFNFFQLMSLQRTALMLLWLELAWLVLLVRIHLLILDNPTPHIPLHIIMILSLKERRYELVKSQQYNVILVEAGNRVGGRVWSVQQNSFENTITGTDHEYLFYYFDIGIILLIYLNHGKVHYSGKRRRISRIEPLLMVALC